MAGEAAVGRCARGAASSAAAIAVITASQVATSQMTRSAQVGLRAPFFVMCLHTSAMALCLPLARALAKPGQRVLAPARAVAVLLPMWLASSFCYISALEFAPAGLVQTLFGTAPAVVAAMSRVLLAEPFTPRRGAAAVFAFAGMLAVGLSAWGGGSRGAAGMLLGAALALLAVLSAAGYKVGFKFWFGFPPASEVLGVVGTLGVAAGLLGVPVAFALGATGVEDRWWREGAVVNWPLLVGSAVVDAIYGIAVAFGVALSSPIVVAFGAILGIPSNLVIDAIAFGTTPGAAEIAGAALIVASFVLCVAGAAPPRGPLLPPPRPTGPSSEA